MVLPPKVQKLLYFNQPLKTERFQKVLNIPLHIFAVLMWLKLECEGSWLRVHEAVKSLKSYCVVGCVLLKEQWSWHDHKLSFVILE